MIQSSPQSHAAEALLGGSAPRTAALKAKRNGLANLFSSLLTEARGRIDAAASGGEGKSKGAGAIATEGKKPVSRHSGASAATIAAAAKRTDKEAASRLLAKQGQVVASTKTSPAEQTAAQAFALKQGHQAAASKAQESERKAVEDAGTERTESSKKALLAKRRVGSMDGSNGSEGQEQLAALSLVGSQRNVSMPKQKAEGAIDSDQKKVETAETKKKDKRKDRLELELYDHRTGSPSDPAQVGLKADAPSASDRKAAASEADLVVNLRAGNAERGNGEDAQRPGAAPGTSFSDALARELRENANADIVKHASLVLKDGGEGLLRLSLKPESLGAVKIRLEMADNKIAGHILVESEEALKAFEKELASLEQAFRDGGFDGASLELGVSSDGAKGGNGNPDSGSPRPFFSERLASSTYDASIAAADIRPATTENETLVNVLV